MSFLACGWYVVANICSINLFEFSRSLRNRNLALKTARIEKLVYDRQNAGGNNDKLKQLTARLAKLEASTQSVSGHSVSWKCVGGGSACAFFKSCLFAFVRAAVQHLPSGVQCKTAEYEGRSTLDKRRNGRKQMAASRYGPVLAIVFLFRPPPDRPLPTSNPTNRSSSLLFALSPLRSLPVSALFPSLLFSLLRSLPSSALFSFTLPPPLTLPSTHSTPS